MGTVTTASGCTGGFPHPKSAACILGHPDPETQQCSAEPGRGKPGLSSPGDLASQEGKEGKCTFLLKTLAVQNGDSVQLRITAQQESSKSLGLNFICT